MTWNHEQLKASIKQDTISIRELKTLKRESGQPRWDGLKELELLKAKKNATLHCALAAHTHGRTHLPGMTREEQEELIKGIVADFQPKQAA